MEKIAVLIPCFNEESTIAEVISDFRNILPEATIYVYDNCSTDNTVENAKNAGAIVRSERKKGKGNVVRKMFADIDADKYVLIDGDCTYEIQDTIQMLYELSEKRVDMVVAIRDAKDFDSHRKYHEFGNKMFNSLFRVMFDSEFNDVFSGYRVFSKRFVKTFPVMSSGFDIETELTIHAISLSIPFSEIKSKYYKRPANSYSKLNTLKDGSKILFSMFVLLKDTRPLMFFGVISVFSCVLAIILLYPIFMHFIETGLVPRLPTAILSMGLMIISCLSICCGMILNGVSKCKIELKRLHYLFYR